MVDPRSIGERRAIELLLPGVTVAETQLSETAFCEAHKHHRYEDRAEFGTILDQSDVYLWQRLPDGRRQQLHISRNPVPLTKRERAVLLSYEKTQRGLFTSNESRAAETSSRIASYNAFGNIMVARYLRGHGAANFWTPNLILSELQVLSLQRYEGNLCTSGVIYVREPEQIIDKLDRAIYAFEPLAAEFVFGAEFFALPPAFRYVDGKNAFYVVDNWRRVRGILRLKKPGDFSLFDRAINGHLKSLMQIPSGRMFIANVQMPGCVTIYLRNELQLRWKNLFWSVTDRRLFTDLLVEFGMAGEVAEVLAACLIAVSDLRFGALVLVLNGEHAKPESAGNIGDEGIASALRRLSKGKRIADIMNSNEAVGILTSDGLTTVTKGGVIVGAGEIIRLEGDTGQRVSGGGRTQAALSASKFGLAIKVSEDGPITVFKDGVQQIKFIR